MNKDARIFIAGHRGMVGSAILRKLQQEGFSQLITRTSSELDLRDQSATSVFFEKENPEFVFLAAAKVGGIHANNTLRADFIADNLSIQLNVIQASHRNNVKKLLFLGSSCIYPKNAPQPLKEESLLSGFLEPTNEPYAIAKIAGIKMCEAFRDQYGCNFISAMPTNLYGPNDNYDLQQSHVLPALIRKFHEAKVKKLPNVTIWGTGKPLREFLHVDDLAAACLHLMHHYNDRPFVNVGFGSDVSILELSKLIGSIIGFNGDIIHDLSKPDGTYQKLMDSTRVHNMGWKPTISLEEGISATYSAYLKTLS
jgi:GDP-L-fucose synthase